MRHPHVLQLIMDSLRYWVHGDARRRLPLRPGRHPGARAARRRPPVRLLRPHPAGPGDQPGEADRRALGRRRGRLPGGQLPAPVVGVERQVPRHRARLLARRRSARWASSPTASPAAPTSTPPTAAGPTPASTSSPPTTASRCATSSPTTRSTTRPTARTTATATTDNRSWNCGVEGPTDDPEVLALRARQQRNFLATLLLSQGVPMLLRGRRDRAAPSAATTTPTARTTSSPGSTGSAADREFLTFVEGLVALRRGPSQSSGGGGASTGATSAAPAWATSTGCGETGTR